MKQDYNGVRTAQDLERKYDFTNLEKVNEINNNIIQANKTMLTSNMNTELKLFVEAVTKYMEDYSVDGNITTYYFSGIPSLNNLPTSEWTTDEEKNNHIWDLYYNRETGYVYMFTLEDGTYSWQRLEDYDVEKALALANAARDTKDNQRRLFLQQPVPPYESGDMWKNGDEILICQIGKPSGETYAERDFIIDSKYIDNTVATEVNNKLTVLSGSVLEIENGVDRYSRTLNQTIKVVDEHGNYIGDRSGKTTTITQDLDGFNLSIGAWDSSKGSLSQQTAQLRADVNEIRGEIGDITDVTITKDGIGTVLFNEEDESINESQPLNMSIYPTTDDICYVYPSGFTYPTTQDYPGKEGLVPSGSLTPGNSLVPSTGYPAQLIKYPTVLTIDFYNQTEDEHIYYSFPKDLRRLGTTYDEFVYDYENEECKVIRRIGLDTSGNKYILQNPEEENIEFPEIHLTTGKYVVTFIPFNTAYMKIRLMSQNMYTSQFATKVEMKGEFSLTKSEFNTKLSKKVGNEEVISRINQTAEQITIDASKVNISGVITAINNNTTTTIDGSKITTGTLSASKISGGTIDGENVTVTNLHADNITFGTLSPTVIAPLSIDASKIAANTITGDKISASTIDGTNIKATTIDGANIKAGTIDGTNIKAATIDGTNIKAYTIDAGNIKANAITSDKINVTNLSSINSDLGDISGGSLNIGNGKFKVTSAGALTSTSGTIAGLTIDGSNGLAGARYAIRPNGNFMVYPNSSAARYVLSSAMTYNAQTGVVIASGSNANVSTNGSHLDLKACSGNTAYLACMNTSAGTGERSAVECTNGILKLRATSYITANGQTIGGSSSKATKKHINDLKQKQKDEVYDLIKNIPLKQYDYKKKYGKKFNYGFIIEDIEDTLLKQLLHITQLETNKEIKTYSNEDLTRLLLIVVQELQKKNEDLEKRIEMLEKGDDK